MKEFTTCVATGNCRSVQRTQSEVEESLKIVSGDSHESFLYDAFSFIAPDVTQDFSNEDLPGVMTTSTLIGTSTLSCFEIDGQLIGGSVISLPWDEDASLEQAADMYSTYRTSFGGRLLGTISSRNEEYSSNGEVVELSASGLGLDELDVSVLQSTADVDTRNGATAQSFGFVSGDTLNFLYLLSESGEHCESDFSTVVRQLDTVSVFSNPLANNTNGAVFVPCSRVLSAASLQSYEESVQELSKSIQVNLGSVETPQIYVDSVLEFEFRSAVESGVKVEVIGSRNATQIERQVHNVLEDAVEIRSDEYEVLEAGLYSVSMANDEVSIFVGEVSPDWACGCETKVCPTIVLATTRGDFSNAELSQLDSLLTQVEGREPLEVSVDGVRVADSL